MPTPTVEANAEINDKEEIRQAIRVGELLRAENATVSTAESCTGGLLSARLTSIPGSSQYFLGGVVPYANQVKEQLLGVLARTLLLEGAVSRACVEEMAEGVRRLLGTTYGVAISGIAGPGGGSPQKPVGTVHLAVASPHGTRSLAIYHPGEREEIRRVSVRAALYLLAQAIAERPGDEAPKKGAP